MYEYNRPVALKAATRPEPSRPHPVCRSFKYILRSVKTQAGKSKWAQFMDVNLGRSMQPTWCSISPKWLPYLCKKWALWTSFILTCNIWFVHTSFHPQNGIFAKKNYGEKWSRRIYFEIPPCWKMVNFVTEFVILGKNLPFYEVK